MKHSAYQHYVIRDGKFIGDFEAMYQDHQDPWEQTTREIYASEKAVCLNILRKYGCRKIVEFGSGLGHFTNQISKVGPSVVGVEVSKTAVKAATATHPSIQFRHASFPDLDFLREYKPDCIIMAEITWYVLNELDAFLAFLKIEMPEVLLVHLLNTYEAGEQLYGADRFTTIEEILAYFSMTYLEFGQITTLEKSGARTFFAGKFSP